MMLKEFHICNICNPYIISIFFTYVELYGFSKHSTYVEYMWNYTIWITGDHKFIRKDFHIWFQNSTYVNHMWNFAKNSTYVEKKGVDPLKHPVFGISLEFWPNIPHMWNTFGIYIPHMWSEFHICGKIHVFVGGLFTKLSIEESFGK